MKDEEMALEYSLKINGFTKEDCYDENGELRQFIKSDMDIYLAGLKAGRQEDQLIKAKEIIRTLARIVREATTCDLITNTAEILYQATLFLKG